MKARTKTRLARWALRYVDTYHRLAWPLRIVFVAASVVIGLFALLVIYELTLLAIGLFIVFGILFGLVRTNTGPSRWKKDEEEYMQSLSDAEQRQHEDQGRV